MACHCVGRISFYSHISSSGSKFSSEELKTHRLAIDIEGYLRIDGLRILFQGSEEDKNAAIKASSIRSNTIIKVKEAANGFIFLDDEYDPNPNLFHIDPTLTVSIDTSQITEDQKTDFELYEKNDAAEYYCFLRGALDSI